MTTVQPRREWPGSTLARVPYWVYQDEANYREELRRIFEGPVWNYVALESDLAAAGRLPHHLRGRDAGRSSCGGETGEIHAFENRCAHRGALIALDDCGSTGKRFQCVYHAWSYDLRGELVGVAFEKGANGKGGMPDSFRKAEHGPRRLRTATLGGLVFASLSPRRRRWTNTWARRCARGSCACSASPSRCSAASSRPCRTTGSSTSRT